ncbi:hypothetical protein MUK70_13850 [Dyadobacter chenwenxiniae]|uniref:Uncharacterized protein n=1 Tax=Dyadobacter chenwenxiniae TaxID=2906456 RepID=A0A9X1TCP5_9BACT|nr:hypothetical protein [Dyadobacter chenwenxiniae]MCF0060327.1 hypothetical protein [Dyadobacter chenwenxiniae]UON86060.1 hypothetical protein MUK70_13850 [Dyadobacter chenwenxiniae]
MKNLRFCAAKALFVSIFLFGLSFVSFGQNDTTSAVHVGFIYPLSTNGKHAASYTNRFSLHAIAGLSKSETGVAISGAANLIKQDASGLQMAGAVNLISNNAKGIQLAGAANITGNNANGIQMAGFSNVVKNESKGAQLAGFMNLAGSSQSLQMAGFANITRNDAKGLQISGFLNKGKNVNAQVAGFANVAKNVKGVQLAGLVNIADTSDYPIAIFNFIKSGEKSIAVTLDETMTTIASFRSGGRVLYGIAGIGYNFKDDKRDLYAVEAGLGAHIKLTNDFRLNLEAVSQTLSNFKKGAYNKNALRIIPAYKIGKKLEIFAGPTINYVSYKRGNDYDFVKKFIWKNDGSKDFQGVHFGFNTGIQLIL